MKWCSKCAASKDESQFSRDSKRKDGKDAWCKECRNRSSRSVYARNAERYKAAAKLWIAQHRPMHREYVRQWAERNKDRVAEFSRLWAQHNPVKRQAIWVRRRAREVDAAGSFTSDEFTALCQKYGNRCLACGSITKRLSVDHVVPLSRGGSNSIDNIQPLCLACNKRKSVHDTDYRLY